MALKNWVGGEHEFALNLGELRALQNACDAGPEQIARRMIGGDWLVDDVLEVLRLGLIGSGEMTAKEAGVFVTSLYDKHPLMMMKATALEVITDALTGGESDDVGEPMGTAGPIQNGDLETSTE